LVYNRLCRQKPEYGETGGGQIGNFGVQIGGRIFIEVSVKAHGNYAEIEETKRAMPAFF
jgi:hypothetical protein